MEGYNTHRHNKNPKEKDFHDTFIQEFYKENENMLNYIVFGDGGNMIPNDYLSDREIKIVISTIHCLGS